MTRLYESTTDYEEHITYAGATIADDYDNPDYLYDRTQLSYDGGTTDLQAGYASTNIAYSSATTGWNGSKTVATTATGTGTGSSTATGTRIVLRAATGAGTGTSNNTRVIIRSRIATGTGLGTSNNSIVHEHLRTGYGTGGATSSDTAIGLHIHPRTATGTGTGTSTNTSRRLYRREATGTGTGTGTATGLRFYVFRPATNLEVDWLGTRTMYGMRITPYRALARFLQPGPRGRNVWKLTDGTYTENDPGDETIVAKIYHGGHNNVVDATEKAELVSAGYGDYIS